MLHNSKILQTFDLSDQSAGLKKAQSVPGFFVLNPQQYDGGSIPSRKGDPAQGSDSGKGHRFHLASVKNLRNMETIPIKAISAEQIIYDLVTTDEASRMRQHLRDMLDAFLLPEDESRERKEVYGTYLALDRLIQRSALIQERRAG